MPGMAETGRAASDEKLTYRAAVQMAATAVMAAA